MGNKHGKSTVSMDVLKMGKPSNYGTDFPAVFDYQRIPCKNMVTQDDYFLWRFLEILSMVSAYDVRIPHSERYYGNIMISDILGACRGHIALPGQYQWYQSTESVKMQRKNCHDDLVITLY